MKSYVAAFLALLVLASAACATNANINQIQSNMQLITNGQLIEKLDQKGDQKMELDKDQLKGEVNRNLDILTKSGPDQLQSNPADLSPNNIDLGVSDTSSVVNNGDKLGGIPELGSNEVWMKNTEGILDLVTSPKMDNNADWTIAQGTPF